MNVKDKINRRVALKRMGTVVVGVAVSSSELLSLSSCAAEKKKKRVIFYFTGTGNSLYIARQLANAGDELLSIPQLMKQGSFAIEADEIGLVYPVYAHMPPYMVRQFIQKARLKAGYKFAVLTYGALKCNAVEILDDISQKADNAFDYINTIVMPDNWLPNFDMDEQKTMDKHIPENLEKIQADIAAEKHWHEPVTDRERRMHQGFMNYTGMDPEVGFLMKSEKYFTVTDACIGCVVCVSVCPRGNYKLGACGVEMRGDCEFCFSCIQNCPQKAIQFAKNDGDPLLGQGEVNPDARYRNAHVSLTDIKRANSQF